MRHIIEKYPDWPERALRTIPDHYDEGEPMERPKMNSAQVTGMVTTLLGFLSGMAVTWGFSAEQWVAITGGVAALVAWGIDYAWNKKPVA